MPSTVIRTYEYDAASRELLIRFTSQALYKYFDVPEDVYEAFKSFREKGIFYNQQIKGKFRFERMNG